MCMRVPTSVGAFASVCAPVYLLMIILDVSCLKTTLKRLYVIAQRQLYKKCAIILDLLLAPLFSASHNAYYNILGPSRQLVRESRL